MNIYDTLIIGSGYSSVGYATAFPNTVICEEHQICDTGFYLPLRSFNYKSYIPKTEEGAQLLSVFNSLSLFRENQQNTNGFEFAICRYINERNLNLLLKCRIIGIKQQSDQIYDVTVQTNEGLSHIFARKILDMTNNPEERYFTVLFVCNNIEKLKDKLYSAFPAAQIEPAFYSERFAIHIRASNTDENRIKLEIYEKWRSVGIDAKILYMAPVFYGATSENSLCDCNYENPIEAFEAGYFYAKERNI